MQTRKNKTMAIIIAVILISSTAISMGLFAAPAGAEIINGVNYNVDTASAINAGMHWSGMSVNASATRLLLWNRFQDSIPTHVYMMVAPNPVGVGQQFNVVMFNPQVPPSALLGNDIRYQFKLNITKPDGSEETLPPSGQNTGSVSTGGAINGVFVSDSTGSAYTGYSPDQTGNYTLTVTVLDFYYRWNSTTGGSNDYYGTTFKSSSYTMMVTVQDEPVGLIGLPDIQAMPTEYWTRPIDGQNTNWYQVSSNWLASVHDRDNGGIENRYQADGTAPNSPHILWTRPTEDNGVLGGTLDGRGGGNTFNAGSQYQPRFMNQIIMYGRIYYSPNQYYAGSSDFLDCVDLKTGELIYETNTTASVGTTFQQWSYSIMSTPSNYWFGYYYSQDDPNEHGIQTPGWIFTPNYNKALTPSNGIPAPFTVTNVPSTGAFEITDSTGENLRLIFSNKGTSSNPSYYLAEWNASKVLPMISAGSDPSRTTIDAGLASRYDWNISSPIQFSSTPTIRAAKVGDMLWGSNGSWPMGSGSPSYAFPDETTIWAISLKPESLGQLIYMKNLDIDNANENTNYIYEHASIDEGVFVALEVPIQKFHVYDINTGNELFSTDAQSDINPYGYFTWPSLISVTQTKLAYGMLYTGGYTGMISAYNLTTGELQWRYTAPSGGEKIQNYVLMEGLICDGKLYIGTHEHSADTPLYKGERVRCLNATTGDVLWTMTGWAYPESFATADGVLIYWNNYDGSIYALGKGPSAMTVTAPDVSADLGSSITIKGTVTDISAGTNQAQQAARFPNGVPAVSDDSQSQWMEYVYMQKGRPTNTTGVPIELSVVDGNGNYRAIGTTTSDADGFFSFNWQPDISGKYTVYASFAGSESYWPSHAVTAFSVDDVAPTSTPVAPVDSVADQYFVPAIAGLFVAIIVLGLLTMFLVLRKH